MKLKSKNDFEAKIDKSIDFEAVYDIILETGVANYMQKFVVIQPGDWPCQFYCRQIVYTALQKYLDCTSSRYNNTENSTNNSPQENHSFSSTDSAWDHYYSFPSSATPHIQPQNFSLNTSVQPSILSVVPIIGPLHISLNARENIVMNYHSFFRTIYEKIFPKSKFPDTPRP